MIKQMLFGKYFVNKIAGYNTYRDPISINQEGQEPIGKPNQIVFSDYRQEKTYDDLKTPETISNIGEVTGRKQILYSLS